MKRSLIFRLLVIAFVTFSLLVPVSSAADTRVDNESRLLVITQPSVNETHFAEMRDLYIYGVFPQRLDNPGNVRIELFKGNDTEGERVRFIESHVDPATGITPSSSLEKNYSEGLDWGNPMIADLVNTPGGLYDPSNKVVVTHEYYQGLILGGVTKNFDTTYRDSEGNLLKDLTAGNYTIRVSGLSGNLSGQETGETITFGLTDSMFGTDRPPINLQNRLLYGWSHHLRIDRDWFPGYFLFPGYGNKGYSIPKRWNPNNAIEAVNDLEGTILDTPLVANNTMILYNINDKSTSYGVELSAILKYCLEDSRNTTFLRYDIGEPFLPYIDQETGLKENVTGTLVSITDNDRIAFTRAELYPPGYPERENIFDPWNNSTVLQVDYNVSDEITIPSGYVCNLYGVTRPIGSSVIETPTPHRYMIDNRIANITYQVRDNTGEDIYRTTRSVNLSRLFNQGSPDRFNSLFEFGHEFRMFNTPGRYTILAQGIDITGNPVPGTEKWISVSVS